MMVQLFRAPMEILMSTLINWAMYSAGAFYFLFILTIIRRACQPSCRNCMYYQDCLDEQLAYAASGGEILPQPVHCSHRTDLD